MMMMTMTEGRWIGIELTPVAGRQHQRIVGACVFRLAAQLDRLARALGAAAGDNDGARLAVLVQHLAGQPQDLLALVVQHVHGLAVGALDDEPVDAALGQARQVRADGVEVERLVGVEEGDGGHVDAAGRAGDGRGSHGDDAGWWFLVMLLVMPGSGGLVVADAGSGQCPFSWLLSLLSYL